MNNELQKKLNKAQTNKKANRLFLQKIGKNPPKNLDYLFANGNEDYFSNNSCLDCANCCKTTSPIFRDVDIERIASHLKIKPGDFASRYLHLDEDHDWVLNTSPCPFLDNDNYCKIYDVRPRACREYPHMERKNISQIMDLTFRNTLVCPAVADVVEKIKQLTKS